MLSALLGGRSPLLSSAHMRGTFYKQEDNARSFMKGIVHQTERARGKWKHIGKDRERDYRHRDRQIDRTTDTRYRSPKDTPGTTLMRGPRRAELQRSLSTTTNQLLVPPRQRSRTDLKFGHIGFHLLGKA